MKQSLDTRRFQPTFLPYQKNIALSLQYTTVCGVCISLTQLFPVAPCNQELPRIAREQTAYWARIVTGLDPLTAHVLTAQWEAAGGATGMPDFYGAIFGEDMAPPRAGAEDGGVGDDAVSRFGGATSHAGVDLMESPSTRCDGVVSGRGIGGGVKAAGMEAGFGETSAQAEVVQSDDLCGVALQERLIRLKEAFAREEFGKLLRTAVGW